MALKNSFVASGIRERGVVSMFFLSFFLFQMTLATFKVQAQWLPTLPMKSCGSDSSMYSVQYFDHEHAFAVGEDGAAYRSADGGKIFSPMNIGTASDLYEVRFLSPSIGFICGDKGTLARTSDGGLSWNLSMLSGYQEQAFYAMEWITPDTGFICGGASVVAHGQVALPNGFILRTTDAGKNWSPVHQDAVSFFWSIGIRRDGKRNIVPHVTGYSPISGGMILSSSDSGTSWRVATSHLPFLPHDISFCEESGVAVGGNPFDFNASPRIVVSDSSGVWSILPDTISTKGFAWSAEAYISDTSSASSPPLCTLLIGLHSGVLLRDEGAVPMRIPFLKTQEKISSCPLYDLSAHHRSDPQARLWENELLAAGSGRGLFHKTERGTVVRVENNASSAATFRFDGMYPHPLTTATNYHTDIHFTRLASVRASMSVLVIDKLGRVVATMHDEGDTLRKHVVSFDGTNLSSGVYQLILSDGSSRIIKPFVIVK